MCYVIRGCRRNLRDDLGAKVASMKRFLGWVVAFGLMLWANLKSILDWVGRGLAMRDGPEFLSQFVAMLERTPAWMPGVAAFALVTALIWDLLRVRRPPQPEQTRTPIVATVVAKPEFVSLNDAATRAYSEFRRVGHDLAGAAKFGRSPGEVLDWVATYLSLKIAVFGKRNPSNEFEQISAQDIGRSSFGDGANILRDKMYDKSIYFTDLAVRSVEFESHLRAILEGVVDVRV